MGTPGAATGDKEGKLGLRPLTPRSHPKVARFSPKVLTWGMLLYLMYKLVRPACIGLSGYMTVNSMKARSLESTSCSRSTSNLVGAVALWAQSEKMAKLPAPLPSSPPSLQAPEAASTPFTTTHISRLRKLNFLLSADILSIAEPE